MYYNRYIYIFFFWRY